MKIWKLVLLYSLVLATYIANCRGDNDTAVIREPTVWESKESNCEVCIKKVGNYCNRFQYMPRYTKSTTDLVSSLCDDIADPNLLQFCQMIMVDVSSQIMDIVIERFSNPEKCCIESGACPSNISDIEFDSTLIDGFDLDSCNNCTAEVSLNIGNLLTNLDETLTGICTINPAYTDDNLCGTYCDFQYTFIRRQVAELNYILYIEDQRSANTTDEDDNQREPEFDFWGTRSLSKNNTYHTMCSMMGYCSYDYRTTL